MTLVLLPQATRRMLPVLIAQIVVLLKDTSLGFIIGYFELLRQARSLVEFLNFNFGNIYTLQIYVGAGLIYIVDQRAHLADREARGEAHPVHRRGPSGAAHRPTVRPPSTVACWGAPPAGLRLRGPNALRDAAWRSPETVRVVTGETGGTMDTTAAFALEPADQPGGTVPHLVGRRSRAAVRHPAAVLGDAGFATAAGAQSAVVREAVPPARHRRSRCRVVLQWDDGEESDVTFLGPAADRWTPSAARLRSTATTSGLRRGDPAVADRGPSGVPAVAGPRRGLPRRHRRRRRGLAGPLTGGRPRGVVERRPRPPGRRAADRVTGVARRR